MLRTFLFFRFVSLLLTGASSHCSEFFFSFFSYRLCSSLEALANGKRFFFVLLSVLLTRASSECSDVIFFSCFCLCT